MLGEGGRTLGDFPGGRPDEGERSNCSEKIGMIIGGIFLYQDAEITNFKKKKEKDWDLPLPSRSLFSNPIQPFPRS
jgi:hypothetical protein